MSTPGEADLLGVEDRARLLEAIGQAVIATDVGGRVTYWNEAAERLSGWAAADVVGRDVLRVAVPDFTAERGAEALRELLEGRAWTGGITAMRKDGSTFTAIVTGTALRDPDGTVVGATAVVTNLGQVLRPLLTRAREAAVVTSRTGVVQLAGPAVAGVLGWTDAELAGRALTDLVHPEDLPGVEQPLRDGLEAPAPLPTLEFRVRTRSGDWVWVEALVADLLDDASVRGLVWTLRDISERRAALERMTEMALHDPLTGLPNRVLLADRLAQATARRTPHGALLFIDLDGFKGVNDELGHEAGDALLKAVADRLSRTVRPEDSCGRWAGDEFLVLNEGLRTRAEAVLLAERVVQAIAAPLDVAGRVLRPRASVGIAMLDGDHDADRLLRRADEDMYRVKRRRRDGC